MQTTFLSSEKIPLRTLRNNLLNLKASLLKSATTPHKRIAEKEQWSVLFPEEGTDLLLQSSHDKPLKIRQITPLLPHSNLLGMPCLGKLLLDICPGPFLSNGARSCAAGEFREDHGKEVEVGVLDDLAGRPVFRTVD